MLRKKILKKKFVFVLVAFFSLCIADGAQAKTRLSLVSGSTGGTYYVVQAGVAKLLEKYGEDILANVQGGTTSTENAILVGSFEADLGIGSSDTIEAAYTGGQKFVKKYTSLRLLIRGYSSMSHQVVLKGSSFNTISDLKGKRIASYPGSTAEYQTPAILEAFGMVPGNDYVKVPLKIGAAAAALRDGHVDAIIQVGGVPLSAITDIAATKGVRFLPIPEDKMAMAMKKNSWMIKGKIPKGAYPGLEIDCPTIGQEVYLYANTNLSEDVVYDIMKVILEHTDELAEIHPKGKFFNVNNGYVAEPVLPYHPGALKYYKEKGVVK